MTGIVDNIKIFLEILRKEGIIIPLFEEIGKRITDVGQGAAQQAKNLSDLTRLNSAVSEKEKRVSQLYLAIGQAYYAAHKDEPTPEYPEMVAELNQLFAEIQQSKDAIQQIKNIGKCPACGAEVKPGAKFCMSCGKKLD